MKLTIPSEATASRELQKSILDEVARCQYDEGSVFAIKLAVEEGITNAIKHGNKYDPGKNVHVDYTVTPQKFEITIEDEGPGFDLGEVPDPTCEENLEKCSGRGILLIGAYMTKVEYSNGGRRLHMIKVNDSPKK